MRQTRLPASASAAPRLTVVVVFPTPPFWFISAMIRMGVTSVSLRESSRFMGISQGVTCYWILDTRGALNDRSRLRVTSIKEQVSPYPAHQIKEPFRRGWEGFFFVLRPS